MEQRSEEVKETAKNREETNRMNRKLNGPILVSRTGDVG